MEPNLKFLRPLKDRIAKASRPPWTLKEEVIGGFLIATAIENNEREIVGPQGLLYGLSESYQHQVDADIDFLLHSRQDCEVLLKALLAACGNDEEKADFLIAHIQKELNESQ